MSPDMILGNKSMESCLNLCSALQSLPLPSRNTSAEKDLIDSHSSSVTALNRQAILALHLDEKPAAETLFAQAEVALIRKL